MIDFNDLFSNLADEDKISLARNMQAEQAFTKLFPIKDDKPKSDVEKHRINRLMNQMLFIAGVSAHDSGSDLVPELSNLLQHFREGFAEKGGEFPPILTLAISVMYMAGYKWAEENPMPSL